MSNDLNTILQRLHENEQRLQQLYHMMFRQVLNELLMLHLQPQ
jgi:hypothetical protein